MPWPGTASSRIQSSPDCHASAIDPASSPAPKLNEPLKPGWLLRSRIAATSAATTGRRSAAASSSGW